MRARRSDLPPLMSRCKSDNGVFQPSARRESPLTASRRAENMILYRRCAHVYVCDVREKERDVRQPRSKERFEVAHRDSPTFRTSPERLLRRIRFSRDSKACKAISGMLAGKLAARSIANARASCYFLPEDATVAIWRIPSARRPFTSVLYRIHDTLSSHSNASVIPIENI